MTEADSVPQLVQARQVDNRFAHERIGARRAGDVGAERRYVRPDEDRSTAPPLERQRAHLAILTRGGRNEVHAQKRVAFARRRLKLKRAANRAFPYLQRPARQVTIAGPGI